jgi:putative flippase GtrA
MREGETGLGEGAGAPWRFGVIGVLNTVVGLAVILLAREAAGWSDVAANALGYGVGLSLSFVLNRRWTFRHKGRWLPAALRFVVVVFGAWLLNISCVVALLDIGVPAAMAHVISVIPYGLATYYGGQLWAFADSGGGHVAAGDCWAERRGVPR